MEDYKQKYEQALKNINKIKIANKDNKELVDFIEFEYPELKDSKDERIRKELIEYLKTRLRTSFNQEVRICKDGIAYLEKQGEQNPTNKFEPKFKVGDWITNGACTIQITSVDDMFYWHTNDCIGGDIESIDKQYHLWTIQDAEDGDVLVSKIKDEPNDFIYIFNKLDGSKGFWSHCYLDAYINNFHEGIYHNNNNYGIPATKEQCNLLFQKMHEAGYKWNAEKKELKKQKPANRNSRRRNN